MQQSHGLFAIAKLLVAIDVVFAVELKCSTHNACWTFRVLFFTQIVKNDGLRKFYAFLCHKMIASSDCSVTSKLSVIPDTPQSVAFNRVSSDLTCMPRGRGHKRTRREGSCCILQRISYKTATVGRWKNISKHSIWGRSTLCVAVAVITSLLSCVLPNRFS